MDGRRTRLGGHARVGEHLSYANVMATLAVFIALGGGAWAIAIGRDDVGSREIAKNAVGTSELKNNKTKGRDVDESSLGEVPSAAFAQNTANADALGGVAAESFAAHINAKWSTEGAAQADEPFGTFGALTLTGRCVDQGANPRLEIRVQNTGPPASGKAQITYVETGGTATDSTSQSVGSSQLILLVENDDGAEGAGVLVYSDSAQVTVVPFRLFTELASGDAFCEFAGQATTTTSP